MSTTGKKGSDGSPGLNYVFTSNYFIFNTLALLIYPLMRKTVLKT